MRTKLKKCLGILALFFVGINSSIAQWVNNQAADAVYGQADFISMTAGSSSNNNLIRPVSVAFTKFSRKVIIGAKNTTSGQSSQLFFYDDYTDINNTKLALSFKLQLPAVASGKTCAVNSVFVDEDDNLWVAMYGDTDDNLYKFVSASTLTSTSTPTATFKIKRYSTTVTKEYTYFIGSVFVKSGVLIIADYMNHIVARYNISNLTTSGTVYPDGFLGKFSSGGTPQYGKYESGGLSRILLAGPIQVNIDKNNALWIADTENARVLKISEGFTFHNETKPSLTLGRNDYTESAIIGNPNNTLDGLAGIATDASGRLYVATNRNGQGAKILIYNPNSATFTNNTNANPINVIGHNVINSTYPNHGSTGYADNKIFYSYNIAVNDYLWVTDYQWNRVMRFAPSSTLPVTLTDFKATQANGTVNLSWKTSSETNNSHYIVSVSYDGKNFNKVKHVDAKNTAADYSVSFPIESVLYAGFGLLGLLLLPRQKNKWFKMSILVLSACFLAACAKEQIETQKDEVVYIKLEQVDKDGTVTELGIKSIHIK